MAMMTMAILGSETKTPQQVLAEAKEKIQSQGSIQYKEIKSFNDPMGNLMKQEKSHSFTRNPDSSIGYDFIKDSETGTTVHLDGNYQEVYPKEKTIRTFSNKDKEYQPAYIKEVLKVSPVTFFSGEDWEYVGDTLVSGEELFDFFRIENDKVVNGNTIYTEQHIFIDPNTSLVESYERRNYFNGELSQTIWYLFEDYSLSETATPLSYDLPENYKTSFFGQSQEELLQVGQKAPLFSTTDINNQAWNLEDFKGKKVLLDFSIINCGYCLESLKYFNQEDFKLASNIEAVYINQEDSREEVIQFEEKIGIPFPAISDADEIAKQYGVNSWPLFYLVDEEGIIEDVIIGFDKEKLKALTVE